jgi:hypothetical protein
MDHPGSPTPGIENALTRHGYKRDMLFVFDFASVSSHTLYSQHDGMTRVDLMKVDGWKAAGGRDGQ